ncbi:hypothetical protein BASA81_018176 [Batrachochytrium salamandrivorans]|nr:hypothetical protein BASA81_018176 [Batrachochytrium salamandrivorans]
MDAELATRLNIPLVKIPVPIKLRLADGDSSSYDHPSLLYPSSCTLADMLRQLVSMSPVSAMGLFLGILGWNATTHKVNWESRMVDFGSSIAWKIVVLGRLRIQGLGKPPSTSDISPKPDIPEPEPFDQTSDSAVDSDIDLSLFKNPSMDLDLGVKKPVLQVTKGTSKSVLFAETIQAEVYPFLEVSPVSKTPIPLEINKEFSSVFSESKADILPLHRSFDCAINLSSSAEPSYGRIYQLTREEDKQKDKLRLCMDYRGLNKQTIKDRNPIPLISEMLRTLSIGKIFTTLDLRGAYKPTSH